VIKTALAGKAKMHLVTDTAATMPRWRCFGAYLLHCAIAEW